MKGNQVKLHTRKEVNILEKAKSENVEIKSFCTIGCCGRCTIKVIDGKVSQPGKLEIARLGQKKIDQGYRLACKTSSKGDITIEV